MNSQNYAFAVANIRSCERKLVNKNQLERLIDAKHPSSFFEALNETAYANFFSDNKNPEDFQEIIAKEMLKTRNILKKIAPYPDQLNWLWLKYDFINLKLAIKKHLAKENFDNVVFSQLGSINPNTIILYLQKQQKNILPEKITKIIDQTINTYQENKNPSKIDQILDKNYFVLLKDELDKAKSKRIKDLIKSKIDLYNLKLLLRYKNLQKEKKELKNNLINNGHIDISDILDAYEKKFPEIPKEIKFISYQTILEAGIEYLIKEKSYLVFEKLSYEYFMNQLRFAKYEAFGIEPLIAYWLAKDNEANILRIVMVGKLNDITPKLIHAQLHKLYTEK